MANKSIASLCTEKTHIRSTFVSDTFRADILLNNVYTTTDIERFQVPFTPVREKILHEKYGLSDADLKEYYKTFSHGLRNGILIADRLHKNPAFEEGNSKSLVSYLSKKSVKNGDSYEVYLLSVPMTRYFNSDFCKGGGMSFQTLVNLATRITLLIHKLSDFDVHLGVLDLDSLCLTKGTPGSQPAELITFTSLLYARSAQDKVVFPYQKVLPFSAHPSLLNGGYPTEATDMYSMAASIAALVNGTYGTENPSISLDSLPVSLPEPFIDALKETLQGNTDSKAFIKMLRAVKKSPTFEEDSTALRIQFNTEMPDYLAELPAQPEEEAEEPAPAVEPPVNDASTQEEAQDAIPELLDGEFEMEPMFDKSFILPDFALGE